MAYDPYDRGDNPWRSDFGVPRMDMPRSRPSAKPGAGRASAAAPPPKKKPVPATTATPRVPLPPRRPAGVAGRSTGPEVTTPIAEDRYERFDLTGKPLTGADRYGPESERLGVPFEQVFPPKVPEMNLNPDERNVPPPLSNLPPPPDVPPPNIPTGLLAGGGGPGVPPAPGGPAAVNAAPPTVSSTGGPTPMMGPGFLNFLRSQLFHQGRPVT